MLQSMLPQFYRVGQAIDQPLPQKAARYLLIESPLLNLPDLRAS